MKEIHKGNSLNEKFYNSFKEYKLSKKEIDLTHKLIEKAFKKYNSNLTRNGYKVKPLSDYQNCDFLLTPSKNEDGDIIVFVNAYCGGVAPCVDLGTLEEWFEVRDGGNSMLRFVLNLSKRTFSNIAPNGEA